MARTAIMGLAGDVKTRGAADAPALKVTLKIDSAAAAPENTIVVEQP